MKILFVTTISNTVNAFLIPHIKLLVDQGHRVDVAFNIVQEVNPELEQLGCSVYNLEFQRSPFSKNNLSAYKNLKMLIQNEGYELVHTHTPVASACVRFACRNLNNIKVIYTAHGFHFYKGAPIINWLIYYPIERLLARFTDVLISINKEDYSRAKKLFEAKKVKYVPGVGIDIKKFQQKATDIKLKREQLGLLEKDFILLSVGELNKNKNHETVIKAMSKLKNPTIQYLICGQGNLEAYLKDLITQLGLEKQVKLLGFRKDINEICHSVDVFIFPSFREGLSVALMEAMATGLPVVSSKIRGNSDLIDENKGGLLVEPDDIEGFWRSIEMLYYSEELRNQFHRYNLKKIVDYSIDNVMVEMECIYKS